MNGFYRVLFCFLLLVSVWHLLTKKYINPYRLIFVFAKKGAGKSTFLAKQAVQHLKAGWTVYSTEPIPGTYHISPNDIGFYALDDGLYMIASGEAGDLDFSPASPEANKRKILLLIDEVSLIWHARDFKTFPKEVRQFFKLQRHYGVKVIMCSQSFDVDKSIRDLADDMWLLQKKFRVFSYGKRILKKLDIVEATGNNDGQSKIVDQLVFDSVLFFWCGSRSLTFIPRYIKYFNSFDAPELKHKDYEYFKPLEMPRDLRKQERRRRREAKRSKGVASLRAYVAIFRAWLVGLLPKKD